MDDDKSSTEFKVRPLKEGDPLRTSEFPWPNMSSILSGIHSINAMESDVDLGAGARHEAWIVEAAGRLIGLAMLVVERDALAHLKWIGVAPDVLERRQITKVLVEHVMRYTWESGCLKLIVHTSLAP